MAKIIRLMNVRQLDRRYIARSRDAEDLQVVRAEGSYLIGPKGKRYIDFTVGWCVGNLGWGNKEIRSRIRKFKGPDYVSPGYLYRPWVELAERLAEITPGRLQKSFRATGGTEAVEIALRTAMIHTRRRKFLSIEGSYHGDSVATPGSRKISPPLNMAASHEVEEILKKRDTAALVMEPIVCNLDVVIPDIDFMLRVQHLCKKYGTLLIMDEVATGFGRTGKLFATEHYGIEPDVMCLGKAITGGYAPMGATVMTEVVAKSLLDRAGFGSTYGWHPRSVEAALANLDAIMKNRVELMTHVERMSATFLARLLRMNFRYPAEIRIKGLAIGVDFKRGGYAGEFVARARKLGLVLSESGGESFTIFPALNIDPEIAEAGLDILEECCEMRGALAA